MTPERVEAIAQVLADSLATGEASSIGVSWAEAIAEGIKIVCAEQREIDAKICDTTAEFHGFYGTAAKDAAVKIRGGN